MATEGVPYERMGSSTSQLQELSQELQALSRAITNFARNVKLVGTVRDKPELRRRLKTTKEEMKANLLKLTRTMKGIKVEEMERTKYDKIQKNLKDEASRFEEVMREFTRKEKEYQLEVQEMEREEKEQTDRREGRDTSSRQQQQQQHQHQQQEQQQEVANSAQMSTLETDRNIEEEKLDELQNMETELRELSDMFVDLGNAVQEQGGDVRLIGEHVSDANVKVEQGTEYLKGAHVYQKKFRKKMCIVICIIVVIALVLGLVFGLH